MILCTVHPIPYVGAHKNIWEPIILGFQMYLPVFIKLRQWYRYLSWLRLVETSVFQLKS
jgi:hypothetical protein